FANTIRLLINKVREWKNKQSS
uniref:Cupiennin-6b n=1 Tax=Cupiennius salei TaxID=6928 RepID=TXC6B_CUPSA|nr:RecName: Full=Cupiennin-6b; Short=Cu-6b; AltName: Full=Short cationic peptide-6b; Short=SCP-6b [Cupiennius salei]